jgi:hypothetical protein
MKVAMFVMWDMSKTAEVAKAADQVKDTPGRKLLVNYMFQGKPFDGLPPTTAVSITISEVESNEALTVIQYAMGLAGATTWVVPVFEIPVGKNVETEKKVRK